MQEAEASAQATEKKGMSREAKKTLFWLGIIYGGAIVATVFMNI
ncbi:MAG: hypothetical protein PHH26_00510 [Candidatus Thermoplasmatota archaeon]|nr:hypothetical protein [Candidatus Thermoplasmatota archaeon]